MAKRFGGKFSPNGTGPTGDRAQEIRVERPAHPAISRTRWIPIMAVPFLLGAFFQPVGGMIANLAAFGMIAAGSWLTREGLTAEAEYNARSVARRPAIPRKLFGGILTGLGLAVGAFAPGALIGTAVIGLAGVALHYLAFGPDPMRDKGMEGVDRFQQDRVARIVEDGEAYLTGMQDAIKRAGDRRLEARVALFAETARDLFRQVEESPEQLAGARRYLGVYLMGARDATVKFADLYAHTQDASARADYESLLSDLEANFTARSRQILEGGRSNMDIEIEVLRDRLAREGLRPEDLERAERGEAPLGLEDRRGVDLDLADLIRETVKAGRGARD